MLAAGGAVAGTDRRRRHRQRGRLGPVACSWPSPGPPPAATRLVAGRGAVAVAAVADLVVAGWIAVGGAGIETPEAYTLPAAAGLLLIAVPRLRTGARSWAAEGPAVGVALVPSALVVVADPTACGWSSSSSRRPR